MQTGTDGNVKAFGTRQSSSELLNSEIYVRRRGFFDAERVCVGVCCSVVSQQGYQPSLVFCWNRGTLSRKYSGRGVSLTTHLHVLPRIGMCGVLPPLTPICLHGAVCLTTGQQPLPKRFLHKVRSSASSLSFQCSLVSLKSSGGFLRLLPRLPVTSDPTPFLCKM